MIIKINRNGNYQTYEINNIEDRTTILEVLEQIKITRTRVYHTEPNVELPFAELAQ
jgi:hypothetical protein